jgi:hypothetical protein
MAEDAFRDGGRRIDMGNDAARRFLGLNGKRPFRE